MRPESGGVKQYTSQRACGYRNPDHFKIAAYFHRGGLTCTRLP